MALTVTIGGATSDSYSTVAEYQAYGALMGWTLSGDDATDEVNLRRAAAYIDRENDFTGYKQYQTQAMAWPRVTPTLIDGWPIYIDTVPDDIKSAQNELAYLIQGGLNPMATVENTGVIASRAKAGPVETETTYAGGGRERPRLVAVDTLLRPYIGGGGSGQVRLQRG